MVENILFGIFIFCFLSVAILALVFAAINLFGLVPGLIIFGLFAVGFVIWFCKMMNSKYKDL
jgi:hypothetical protein